MGSQYTNMKAVVASLTFASVLALKQDPFIPKEQAADVFDNSGREPRGWFDFTTAANGATTANTQTCVEGKHGRQYCFESDIIKQHHLTSVESWEEFKDKLEVKKHIPEEQVDELERCVSSCKRHDIWNDLKGVAHEELKEDYEKCVKNHGENYDCGDYPMACPKCFQKIPKNMQQSIADQLQDAQQTAERFQRLCQKLRIC